MEVTAKIMVNRRYVRARFLVDDEDGSVQVWDDIAGHFTRCHSFKYGTLSRIRWMADKKREKAMRSTHECEQMNAVYAILNTLWPSADQLRELYFEAMARAIRGDEYAELFALQIREYIRREADRLGKA